MKFIYQEKKTLEEAGIIKESTSKPTPDKTPINEYQHLYLNESVDHKLFQQLVSLEYAELIKEDVSNSEIDSIIESAELVIEAFELSEDQVEDIDDAEIENLQEGIIDTIKDIKAENKADVQRHLRNAEQSIQKACNSVTNTLDAVLTADDETWRTAIDNLKDDIDIAVDHYSKLNVFTKGNIKLDKIILPAAKKAKIQIKEVINQVKKDLKDVKASKTSDNKADVKMEVIKIKRVKSRLVMVRKQFSRIQLAVSDKYIGTIKSVFDMIGMVNTALKVPVKVASMNQ